MAVTRTMNGKCTCLDEGHPPAVCYLNSHQMPTCVACEDRKEIVFLKKNIQIPYDAFRRDTSVSPCNIFTRLLRFFLHLDIAHLHILNSILRINDR